MLSVRSSIRVSATDAVESRILDIIYSFSSIISCDVSLPRRSYKADELFSRLAQAPGAERGSSPTVRRSLPPRRGGVNF